MSVANRTSAWRGAVSGAVAASVWAVGQPLDKAVFGSRFDDVELLGTALTRGENAYPIGFALHMTNGALFGALYATLAPAIPGPTRLRAPALALAEHLASWPLVAVTDRFHPARARLPVLSGNRRAFWQALYRHLLFGVVLGELDRRLAADDPDGDEPSGADFSSNGHGRIEHAVSVGTPASETPDSPGA